LAGTLPSIAHAESVLSPAGPVGAAERLILLDALAIMLAIVVPTILATLAFAWWFRASNTSATYRPDWSYSGKIELIVWSIPSVIILFLGGIIWIGSHNLDPARPIAANTTPIEVEIVSLDWKWLFIYPREGIASVNRLVVPAGVPLHFRITSASVFNAFFVPRLGTLIYAMNGMVTQLNLQADRPGIYAGLSAQFSGDGFAGMSFDADAVPSAQFENWVATARANGPALDDAAYRDLLQQSQNITPYTYRSVQNGLFDAVVMQKLPPGPGPQTGQLNAGVKPFGGK
jgi:cytochrome o ubiquinol oxidase subunit 2